MHITMSINWLQVDQNQGTTPRISKHLLDLAKINDKTGSIKYICYYEHSGQIKWILKYQKGAVN